MTSTHEAVTTAHPVQPRRHALIIEDEDLVAAALEEELRALGFTSFGLAHSESEAILFAKQQEPDLITVDVMLGEGSGLTAVLKICAERAVPVIVVTGYLSDIIFSDLVILTKPFNTATFVAAYEQAIAQPFSAARD